MKKSIFHFTVVAIITAALFLGCSSNEQKEEAAKEKIQDAKEDLQNLQQEENAKAIKIASDEEWKTFRIETELKINNNEIRIAELRAKKNKPGKVFDKLYEKRIETLQQKNREMRARLDAYERNKSDWETFKREFNHDMDELGQSLKDFTVDNRK